MHQQDSHINMSVTYIFRWKVPLSLRVDLRRRFLLQSHLFQSSPRVRLKTFDGFAGPWEKKDKFTYSPW